MKIALSTAKEKDIWISSTLACHLRRVRATVVAFSSSLSSSRPLLHPIPYLSTPFAPFLTHLGLFTRLKRRSWLAPRLKLTQKLVPCPSNRTLIEKRRGFEK